MQNNFTNIKGLIAEELCKFHLQRTGFNIIRSGKEWLNKDFADTLINNKNQQELTLKIFNNIIAKLPDFMIWRENENHKIEYKFVEVKFRNNLNKNTFIPSKTQDGKNYLSYKCHENSEDPLEILKYIHNLERLMKLESQNSTDINNIELYFYLVTQADLEQQPNIYFGKVFGKKQNGYQVYFYNPNEVSRYYPIWHNYSTIASHIIQKINRLYELVPIFNGETEEFLQQQIKTILLK